MTKGIRILILCCLACNSVFSQTEEKHVVNSNGAANVSGAIEVITSFGETIASDQSLASDGFLYPFDTLYITSVQGQSSLPEFTYFPNPAHNTINVYGDSQMLKISLCDLNGKTVSSTNPYSSYSQVDLSGIEAGVYFLSVLFENKPGFSIVKIVVQ